MMDDKELIRYAAKAVGAQRVSESPFGDCYNMGGHYLHWDPLGDDGDALRLAVKLQIAIYQWDSGGGCTAKHLDIGDFEEVYCGRLAESVYCEFTANRRAIVRCAAAIGESMP